MAQKNSYIYCAVLQACVAFPKYSNIYDSKYLDGVLSKLKNDEIEIVFFDKVISASSVTAKMGSLNEESILTVMKEIATAWCNDHKDLVDSLPRYYRYPVGRNDNNSVFYLISRNEYIIISVASPLPIVSSASLKKTEGTIMHFSVNPTCESSILSTLFILQPETPLKIECDDWLSFQSFIQELYSSRVPLKSFHTELSAQKLTRIFVQDGVLIPRYYNVYRDSPQKDIYWKWNPLVIPVSIKSLKPLLRQICTHLQNEKSAFLFLNPVNNEEIPNYRKIITSPMDLSTVSRRVDNNYYTTFEAFNRDIMQIFWNGCTFNLYTEIWYQQCCVLKVCYMNIVKQLESSGIHDMLQNPDESENDPVVYGEMRDGKIRCFTSASSPACHVVAKDTEGFQSDYFNLENVSKFLNYPVYRAKQDFEGTSADEISLTKGSLVYLVNKKDSMAEVMRLDLVEMGLVPQDVIEEVMDNEVWKRLRDDRAIENVTILKRGKIVANDSIVQTQYTDYSVSYICFIQTNLKYESTNE